MAGVRPADGPWGAAVDREGAGGKMRRLGVSRESTGFGGPRHAPVVASGAQSPWLGQSVLPCCARPAPAGRRRPRRQGHAPTRVSCPARRSPSAATACPKSQGQPRTWFVDRVHRRRPGPDEPGHRHPALRHHRTPRPSGSVPTARSAPATASRPASSATAIAGRPGYATCVIGVGDGPGTWAPSCASPSRPPPTRPPPPTPHHDQTTELNRGERASRSGVVQPLQVVVPDDPPQPDADRLLQEVGQGRPARDGRGLGRRGRRVSPRSEAMAMERSSWKGSVVTSTTFASWARSAGCGVGDVLVAVVAARLEDRRASARPSSLEVHRARLRLGALVARLLAARHHDQAGRSPGGRGSPPGPGGPRRSGEGTQSYCAAPMTRIAPAGCGSYWREVSQTCTRVTAK